MKLETTQPSANLHVRKHEAHNFAGYRMQVEISKAKTLGAHQCRAQGYTNPCFKNFEGPGNHSLPHHLQLSCINKLGFASHQAFLAVVPRV